MEQREANGHDGVREQYDETASMFEEGRAKSFRLTRQLLYRAFKQ
jgi:hypothetical protein